MITLGQHLLEDGTAITISEMKRLAGAAPASDAASGGEALPGEGRGEVVNISRFSIHRPIFSTMVTLIVILVGVISLLRLPVDLMPDITYPALSGLDAVRERQPGRHREDGHPPDRTGR